MVIWTEVVAVWGDGYILKIEPIGFLDGEGIKCNWETEREKEEGVNIEKELNSSFELAVEHRKGCVEGEKTYTKLLSVA